jgi:hypothetical protein
VLATWRIVIRKLGQLAAAKAQGTHRTHTPHMHATLTVVLFWWLVASWRASRGRVGRVCVVLVVVVQVTPRPHLHLLLALSSDLLPDLSTSTSTSQGLSSLSQGKC